MLNRHWAFVARHPSIDITGIYMIHYNIRSLIFIEMTLLYARHTWHADFWNSVGAVGPTVFFVITSLSRTVAQREQNAT